MGILLQGSAALDSRMGVCLWDLCLDKYTGDGRFDGRAFLVGVSLQHVFRPSRRGSSILDCPGQTRALFRFRQPVDLVHALKTVKGLLLLVSSRTPRSSGYDVYAHAVYVVICYMSVICICLLYVVICYKSVYVICLLYV